MIARGSHLPTDETYLPRPLVSSMNSRRRSSVLSTKSGFLGGQYSYLTVYTVGHMGSCVTLKCSRDMFVKSPTMYGTRYWINTSNLGGEPTRTKQNTHPVFLTRRRKAADKTGPLTVSRNSIQHIVQHGALLVPSHQQLSQQR